MRNLTIVLVLMCSSVGLAGFERRDAGARAGAIGGAFVGLGNDGWAILHNPAGLGQLKSPEISFSYSPQPFGLPQLRSVSGTAAFPVAFGTFGGFVRQFGFDLYKETSFGVAYAQSIEGILAGITIGYHTVSIARYGTAGTLSLDAGFVAPLFPRVQLGVAGTNMNGATIGAAREKLPQTFTVGVAYVAAEGLSLVADYQKEHGFVGSPRAGFEYWFIPEVALRGGASDDPETYAAGIGLRLEFVGFDYGFVSHPELGLTHQASISLWLPHVDR